MVDKYYNEFKEKLKKKQSTGSICSADGTDGAQVVADENVGTEDDFVFMRKEVNLQNKVSGAEEGGIHLGDSNNNQAEYYENPLFIDIPPESEPRFEESAYPTPHLSQTAELCYGGVGGAHGHGHGQQQQQHSHQQMADCMYYGGGGNHGDLLMTVPEPPPTQPMRWNLNANPSVENFSSVEIQRQQYNVGEEEYPINHHSNPQASPVLRHLRQNRQSRPSEELREFVKGLVMAQQQGRLRSDLVTDNRHLQHQVPQLEQAGLPFEQQHHSAQDVSDGQGQGHQQQRRLMSGGGIVEVKYSPPHPSTSQSTIYDDAATREWINSLTSSVAEEGNCGNIEVDGSQQHEGMREGGVENDDYNNNMDNPILVDGIGESPLSNSGSQGSGGLLIGKNSKLAEILGK